MTRPPGWRFGEAGLMVRGRPDVAGIKHKARRSAVESPSRGPAIARGSFAREIVFINGANLVGRAGSDADFMLNHQLCQALTIDENQAVLHAVNANPGALALQQPGHFSGGYLGPLNISQQWGQGWIYLAGQHEDRLTLQTLPMLAIHAANALYVHLLNHRTHMNQAFYPPVVV